MLSWLTQTLSFNFPFSTPFCIKFDMLQDIIESYTAEEYSSLLAYGDPYLSTIQQLPPSKTKRSSQCLVLITTLASTTYPELIFGYKKYNVVEIPASPSLITYG